MALQDMWTDLIDMGESLMNETLHIVPSVAPSPREIIVSTESIFEFERSFLFWGTFCRRRDPGTAADALVGDGSEDADASFGGAVIDLAVDGAPLDAAC